MAAPDVDLNRAINNMIGRDVIESVFKCMSDVKPFTADNVRAIAKQLGLEHKKGKDVLLKDIMTKSATDIIVAMGYCAKHWEDKHRAALGIKKKGSGSWGRQAISQALLARLMKKALEEDEAKDAESPRKRTRK